MKERRIAILLALCMVLSLTLTACRGQETANGPVLYPTQAGTTKATTTAETTTTTTTVTETTTLASEIEFEQLTESWKNKTDPVTFTLASSNHDSMIGKKWAEDEISRHIMNLTGVRLELIYGKEKAPDVNYYDTLMASGELPDLVYLHHTNNARLMAQSGNAAALDELAAEYCPDFWDSLDGKEIVYNTESDGHVYTLRNGYLSDRFYDDPTIPISFPHPLSIRTDLLEKPGEDMPTSVEELEALLRKAKDNMKELVILTPMVAPNIAEFPLANWMGVYTTTSPGRALQWDEENKKIITPMSDSNWYDFLMEMNRWHRDGLFTLTQFDGDIRGTGGAVWAFQGDNILSLARVSYNSLISDNWYEIRKADQAKTEPKYPAKIVTEALTWQGEDQMTAVSTNDDYGLTSGGGLFISQTCHDKERAILFYQFLRGDFGAKLTHWGVEGVHYTLDEEHHVVMTEGNTRAESENYSYGLYDLNLMTDSPVGYWAMVSNPVVHGQYAASPIGAESNEDVIRIRTQLIEAGVNYKKKVAERHILPMSEVSIQEGEPGYEEYKNLYNLWFLGINEMVCADTMELAEARWAQLQEELNQNGLRAMEDALTLRFMEVVERYQKAGYFEDIELR